MIIYDGTYRLQPDPNRGIKPRTKRVSSWQVRIINLTATQPMVRHIKPFIPDMDDT